MAYFLSLVVIELPSLSAFDLYMFMIELRGLYTMTLIMYLVINLASKPPPPFFFNNSPQNGNAKQTLLNLLQES